MEGDAEGFWGSGQVLLLILGVGEGVAMWMFVLELI